MSFGRLASYAAGPVGFAAELMLFTEDANATARMGMDCPHCQPAATYDMD